MAALKGQPTASDAQPRRPRKAVKQARPEGEESDYESGTDEDEESESETDTDTDSEGE
jgi:translocation protein SEC63